MKKKILCGISVLAIAAVAAWNVNFNSQENELSDVQLANVEALAQESDNCSGIKVSCIFTSQCEDIYYSHIGANKA